MWDRLGFATVVADEAFFQLVLARLVEPTSKADSVRVLDELGVASVDRSTMLNSLKRAQERDYRALIGEKCFVVTRLDPGRVRKHTQPVWNPTEHTHAWRVVWHYRQKRAVRHRHTLTQQRNRAIEIAEGTRQAKHTRFLTTKGGKKTVNEKAYNEAMKLAGYKGYVTNIPTHIMEPGEVISHYHELWHVEQSFRISTNDLKARPIFHHTRDAIEAHFTAVFTALAIARHMKTATGQSLKKTITTVRPLREFTGTINGHDITFAPELTPQAQEILEVLNLEHFAEL